MAETTVSPPETADADDDPASIKPLENAKYERAPATERQITSALRLSAPDLIARAQQRGEHAADYLSPEALVYFIRRADGAGEQKTRDALIRELLARCTVFFRGRFHGCNEQEREELQAEVHAKLVEDLLDRSGRGDFMQARFWLYLKRRSIDAWSGMFRHSGDLESLDTGFSGDAESEGKTKLDAQADERLSPEQLTMISEALSLLPPELRRVFLLRHYVGMKIGADNPADDPPDEPTIARAYGRSGRTMRNWLRKADSLLAGFREN